MRIPRSYYPSGLVLAKDDGTPESGCRYRPTEVVDYKKCIGSDNVKAKDEFEFEQWQNKGGHAAESAKVRRVRSEEKQCKRRAEEAAGTKVRKRTTQSQGTK